MKYDFQKPSKIPFIEIWGYPSLIRLKKRRFQCKNCRKVTVSETNLVQKNCQIAELLRQKVAQDFESKKIIAILDNRRQTTIRNHIFKYSTEARNAVKVVTVDMSGSYIPLIKILFPNAKIVLDRFHIVQHMSRALIQTRRQIMKQYDKKSLEYRVLKYHWKVLQKDSRKLSLKPFHSRTFRETMTPRECLEKIVKRVPQLKDYSKNEYQNGTR